MPCADDCSGAGCPVVTLAMFPAAEYPSDLAINANHVYWVGGQKKGSAPDGVLRRVPKCGGDAYVIKSGLPFPYDLEPATDGQMYLSMLGTLDTGSLEGGWIGRADLVSLKVFASDRPAPNSIAVDETDVYWQESSGLARTPLGGGSVTQVAWMPAGAGLAAFGEHVYFSASNYVGRVPKAGGAPEKLADDADPRRLVVDQDAVYWISHVEGIRKYVFATDEVVTLTTTSAVPAIAHDEDELFWMSYDAVNRMPKSGGEPTKMASIYVPAGFGVAVDDKAVYVLANASVLKVPK